MVISIMVLFIACLRGGQERAELDKTVGISSNSGLTIKIANGLASIQSIEPGKMELWMGAPAQHINITLDSSATLKLNINLHNIMPNVEVTCNGSNGKSCTSELFPGDYPTNRLLSIEFQSQGEYDITIAPQDNFSSQPFSFIVLSDIQEELYRVQDIYTILNSYPQARFIISAGDLTDQGEEWELKEFQSQMRSLNIPLFSTPGNHDIMDGENSDWHRLFGRHSFNFVFHDTHFTMADSSAATLDPIVYDWLKIWIDQGVDKMHFFTTHIPIIDPDGFRNGSFRSRQEAGLLLALLAQGRVNVTLYGHVHTYLKFSNGGMDAYISGGGGGWPEKLDGIGRHFLLIKVNPDPQTYTVEVIRVD
jgi:3',5'-cyclic-AMP phosphodiesterase